MKVLNEEREREQQSLNTYQSNVAHLDSARGMIPVKMPQA